MTREDSHIKTADGHLIPLYHWPCDNPHAVIHISHGMAEHGRCYDDVARKLNQQGYAVFAHDHRCHGESSAAAELGRASEQHSFQRICDDMLLINCTIRGHYPSAKLILLGHSMGSFIAQAFAQAHPGQIDALILEGSNYSAPWFLKSAAFIARFECWRQGDNGQSDLLHALGFGRFNACFKPNRTDFDWLSRDESFVDRYVADPLCGFRVSNRYWQEMMKTLVQISRSPSLRRYGNNLPIYIMSGDNDPVGEMGKGVIRLGKMLRRNGCREVSVKLYPDARHDILHETNRDEVMNDMLGWLNQTLAVA